MYGLFRNGPREKEPLRIKNFSRHIEHVARLVLVNRTKLPKPQNFFRFVWASGPQLAVVSIKRLVRPCRDRKRTVHLASRVAVLVLSRFFRRFSAVLRSMYPQLWSLCSFSHWLEGRPTNSCAGSTGFVAKAPPSRY